MIMIFLFDRRDDSHTARYIDMDITSRAKMWDQLLVSLHYYRDCLTKHFSHLHLTKPKSDTCRICDEILNLLKNSSLPIEERSEKQITLDLHQVILSIIL